MKIEVDEHRCVGAGQCVWVAPRVFDQRAADGVVVLRTARPDADDEPYAREAAALCPARAIRVVDDAVPDARIDEGASE